MLTTFRSCLRNGSAGDISRLAGATWSVLYPPIGDARGSRAYSAQTDTPVLKSKKEKESNLYVFNVEGRRNNSPVLLGLMDYFERFIPRIGYFQPLAGEKFVNSTTGLPRHVELLHTYFKMGGDPKAMVALQREDALDMLTAGQEDEMLDAVYAAFQQYSADKEMVIIEGSHRDGPATLPANRTKLNSKMAAMLGAPMLLILDYDPQLSIDNLYSRMMLSATAVRDFGAEVLGMIVNKVPKADKSIIRLELGRRMEDSGVPLLGVLPMDDLLMAVRLDEIQAELGARVLTGASLVDTVVDKVIVACSPMEAVMEHVVASGAERPLLVTTLCRPDVPLGFMAAGMSGAGPFAAGVILTQAAEKQELGPVVNRIFHSKPPMYSSELLATLEGYRLPVLTVGMSVWDVCTKISEMTPSIRPTSLRKIETAKAMFTQNVDANQLVELLQAERKTQMTPKMFSYNVNKLCLENPQRIVLPEALDARVLHAAAQVMRRGLAHVILLGQELPIKAEATRLNVDLTGCQIVDPADPAYLDRYIPALVEARKAKNVTAEQARDMLTDANYFGTMMTLMGDADGMVSGACHTTASTIRPGLQILKKADMPLVSSVFLMCLPGKVLAYADCAVNVHPNSEELAHIAIATADTAKAFGIEPRVALLSYSTLGSGSGPEVDRVTEAVKIVKELRPDLKVEGPIQYDAAVDPEVAAVKIKTPSEVAGKATVCIFPDLNTGNNTYKAVQHSTGAVAIGPLMQGLSKPVNDLSRGCTIADISNTIRCTSVQAMAVKAAQPPSAAPAAAA